MNQPSTRASLRRANPIFMLVVGVLVGALIAAIAQQPGGDSPLAAGTVAGGGSGAQAEGGQPGDAGVAAGTDAAAAAAAGGGDTAAGGAAGAGGAGGAAASGAAGAGACSGAAGPGVQGVTATKIKIGFAVPDLGVLAALIDVGDIPAYVRANLAGLRADGRLPVCGRDIEPVFRTYNVLDPAESRAACVGFAEEDKVFAVLALFGFSGADCVTREKGMLLIDSGNAVTEQSLAASPLLFSNGPPVGRMLRAYTHWLVETGLLDGKKVGVYMHNNGAGGSQPPGEAVKKNVLAVLEQLGHKADVVVATDGCGAALCPDPTDGVAVQRFKSAGVQVALILNYSARFFQQAEAQRYKAQWAVVGSAMATDATTGEVPPDTYDGALGLIFEQVGEAAAGVPLNAQQQRCWGYWQKAGNQPPADRDTPQGQSLRQSCDQLDVLTRGLAAAGSDLTSARAIGGLETIRDLPLSYYAQHSFLPGKHYGTASNLQVRWHKECGCWKSTGPFSPLYGR